MLIPPPPRADPPARAGCRSSSPPRASGCSASPPAGPTRGTRPGSASRTSASRRRIADLLAACDAEGRDPATLELTVGPHDRHPGRAGRRAPRTRCRQDATRSRARSTRGATSGVGTVQVSSARSTSGRRARCSPPGAGTAGRPDRDRAAGRLARGAPGARRREPRELGRSTPPNIRRSRRALWRAAAGRGDVGPVRHPRVAGPLSRTTSRASTRSSSAAAPATSRRGWPAAARARWASTTRRSSSRPRPASSASTASSSRSSSATRRRSPTPTPRSTSRSASTARSCGRTPSAGSPRPPGCSDPAAASTC